MKAGGRSHVRCAPCRDGLVAALASVPASAQHGGWGGGGFRSGGFQGGFNRGFVGPGFNRGFGPGFNRGFGPGFGFNRSFAFHRGFGPRFGFVGPRFGFVGPGFVAVRPWWWAPLVGTTASPWSMGAKRLVKGPRQRARPCWVALLVLDSQVALGAMKATGSRPRQAPDRCSVGSPVARRSDLRCGCQPATVECPTNGGMTTQGYGRSGR